MSKRKKVKNSITGGVKFKVMNIVTQKDFSEEKELSKLSYDYIPFGDKIKNDLPQHLAMLRRKSATHRSILEQKVSFSLSSGFSSEDENLLAFLKNVNSNGENFTEVWYKILADNYTFANAYIEVVTYDGGVNIFHIDATQVRKSKDTDSIIVHHDWDNYNHTRDKAVVIPMYPNYVRDGNLKRSAIHLKKYEPEFKHYGLPDYAAVLESISVDYEIGRWNNSRFKNFFQPSAIVEINGDMSDDEAENLIEEAKSKFTGEGNNGKILFMVKNGDSSPATVTPIADTSEGNFLDLQNTTNQNIITAHRWQPALSGIVSAGKMNNTGSEIRIAYEMVMTTVVKNTVNYLMRPIKKVLMDNGYSSDDLEVQFEPPISFFSDVNIAEVLEINEMRQIIGYDEKPDYDKLTNQKEEEDAELEDGYHRMPDGTIMKDSEHEGYEEEKKEAEVPNYGDKNNQHKHN